ncbi:MAG TPA: sulfite exporter TauE/SafE family protein [Actinomycetota bacterium]|nr:sulfite exporter TauE/SafE family protein [Actinomycetota bacterium]
MTAGLLRDALALLLGFVTGVLSALFGIGGAIVSNPGLRILGAAPLVAVGTTLPSILPGVISGTLRYRREGLIDWRLIIPAAAAGLLAVVGGSLLSHAIPGQGHLLLLLIAVLLAVTAWRTAFTGATPEAEVPGAGDNREHPTSPSATLPLRGGSHRRVGWSRAVTPGPGSPAPTPGPAGSDPVTSGRLARRRRWIAAGIGLSAGLLSGLLGIGGGVIMVPAFTELLSMSLKSAIATSLVCVGIFGVPATITHAFLGDVDWRLAILLAIGVIPGARVGAALTIRTAERRLRLAVGVFLALVALVYFVTETRALLAL